MLSRKIPPEIFEVLVAVSTNELYEESDKIRHRKFARRKALGWSKKAQRELGGDTQMG